MTDSTDHAVPPGLADLPLEARQAREVETRREIQDGLTSRHLSIATYRQRYLAAQFARVLRMGKG